MSENALLQFPKRYYQLAVGRTRRLPDMKDALLLPRLKGGLGSTVATGDKILHGLPPAHPVRQRSKSALGNSLTKYHSLLNNGIALTNINHNIPINSSPKTYPKILQSSLFNLQSSIYLLYLIYLLYKAFDLSP